MPPATKYRLLANAPGYSSGTVLTYPSSVQLVRSHYPGQTIADLVRAKIMQKIVANALGSRSSSRRRRRTSTRSRSTRKRSTSRRRRRSSSRR
jgi:hypothetical protein